VFSNEAVVALVAVELETGFREGVADLDATKLVDVIAAEYTGSNDLDHEFRCVPFWFTVHAGHTKRTATAPPR
jgi:hypothetical protein